MENLQTTAGGTGGSGFQFRTPAGIVDFPNKPLLQEALNLLWNNNLKGFTSQGMLGNPWNATNVPPATNYYDPQTTNPPSKVAPVVWSPFPGRIKYNYPNDQSQWYQMADTGVMPSDISDSPCGPPSNNVPYYPYGPRGWQDEYCEWCVTRDPETNKITRVDFVCENPEYWNSLWLIDPGQVLSLYQSILNKPQITLDDLSLPGAKNHVTGGPVYNPLNKWNSGTESTDEKGGAIHLTSTPNTIQTEIGLASAASVLRINPNPISPTPPPPLTTWLSTQNNALLCDAQYGQKFRNSDPTIGFNVNSLVNAGASALGLGPGTVVTLADPPGLYIQSPVDFSAFQPPTGHEGDDMSKCWRIIRGSSTLNDQQGNPLPGNYILHAVFEVPADWGYVVGDITINGAAITFGSMITETLSMQILAGAYQGTVPTGYQPVGSPDTVYAQPLQLFYEDYYTAMYTTMVANPVKNPISLLSNSTYIPPTVFTSANQVQMVLTVATCTAVAKDTATFPAVTFDDPNIKATVTKVVNKISYAVPGNSLPNDVSNNPYTALYLTVNVGVNTAPGSHGVFVTNAGQTQGTAMPALLMVLPTTIQANVAWQNTGVVVTAGTTVKIAYVSGLWTDNPHDNGGQLYNANGTPSHIVAKPGYAMPGQNEGAMVGRVGNTVFLVGMGVTVPSGLSGELSLCINDDLDGIYGAGLTDNIGSITVQITIG